MVVRGEGVYLYDANGKQYLDGSGGAAISCLGHGNRVVIEAIKAQVEKLAFAHTMFFTNQPQEELAGKLAARFGTEDARVYFLSGGSEANETAIKMARQYWLSQGCEHKHLVISRRQSYHGNTLGALSATGQAERRFGYEPLVPGFIHIDAPDPYRITHDCADQLERAIEREGSETVAAFIMEPIIAGGGVLVPPDDYLPRVREICSRHGVLLILDEVVTGFGRTGVSFVHKRAGVEPDLLTLGKGIASGYQPLAAMVAAERVFEAFKGESNGLHHFRHINTYGGHPVATAVGLRNIEILERDIAMIRKFSLSKRCLARLPRPHNRNNRELSGSLLKLGRNSSFDIRHILSKL